MSKNKSVYIGWSDRTDDYGEKNINNNSDNVLLIYGGGRVKIDSDFMQTFFCLKGVLSD